MEIMAKSAYGFYSRIELREQPIDLLRYPHGEQAR
jgi:hypothetical protein